MDLIYAVDLFAILVFAVSGVLAAVEKKFDLVGAFILAVRRKWGVPFNPYVK